MTIRRVRPEKKPREVPQPQPEPKPSPVLAQGKKPAKRVQAAPTFKRRCSRCRGTGYAPCQICGGNGEVVVSYSVSGAPTFRNCSGCSGTKRSKCMTCGSQGFV